VNQIRLSDDVGIDTDEVMYWYQVKADAEGRLSSAGIANAMRVLFKNGKEAILRGDAKATFDKWVTPISNPCLFCARRTGGSSCTRRTDEEFPECHRLKAQ
jgi:hypothetical protein